MRYKYCVWFPKRPKATEFFTNRRKAETFLNKQKEEAYLNIDVGIVDEDTVKGNRFAIQKTETGEVLFNWYWQAKTLKEFNHRIKDEGNIADREYARTLYEGR